LEDVLDDVHDHLVEEADDAAHGRPKERGKVCLFCCWPSEKMRGNFSAHKTPQSTPTPTQTPIMASSPSVTDDLNTLARFLARRDIPSLLVSPPSPRPASHPYPFDILVLCGSAIVGTVQTAVDALKAGLAPILLISGGVGHSTGLLVDAIKSHPIFGGGVVATSSSTLNADGTGAGPRAEAEMFRDVALLLGAPPEQVLVECVSTNCGSNASESLALLRRLGLPHRRLLLLQDPTMCERSHATFRHWWRDTEGAEIVAYAPFVPTVVRQEGEGGPGSSGGGSSSSSGSCSSSSGSSAFTVDAEGFAGAWTFPRLLSLLVGEVPRLRDDEAGYGPNGKGFIAHVDIPAEVESAYARVRAAFPEAMR
jgi:uncharacterized SAM-binding protein YcdF (DUF218 family)